MARRGGFCYKPGHNRRNCPVMRKDAKQDPAGWAAYELAKVERAKKTVRRCSWCTEPGHTKRTCQDLKQALVREEENARIWNKTFLDKLKHCGLGVGSLLRITAPTSEKIASSRSKWIQDQINSFGGMALVMGFVERECVSVGAFNSCMLIKGASGLCRRVPLPYEIAREFYQYAWQDYLQFEVVGKVSDHQVATSFSQKWHQGEVGARAKLRLDQR